MAEISIKIDEDSKYTIDLKQEYSAKEFISTLEGHLSKIKNFFNHHNVDLKNKDTKKFAEGSAPSFFNENILFNQLSKLVEELGNDITKADKSSMRCYYSISRRINKRRGLVWIQPVGNSLVIYLRKGNFNDVDVDSRIIYSKLNKRTFGDYPIMRINEEYDVEYAFKIIKKIYETA